MKLRMVAAGLGGLALLAGGLITAAPAQAATTGDCEGWISGEWGHGKCNNTHYAGRTMKLDVVCDAWWDADVHLEAVVPKYSTMELQGHCMSSVVSASAYWA